MRPLEALLVRALGYPVRVSRLLPYMSTDKDGNERGMVHWMQSGHIMFVSKEMWNELQKLPRSSTSQRGT